MALGQHELGLGLGFGLECVWVRSEMWLKGLAGLE